MDNWVIIPAERDVTIAVRVPGPHADPHRTRPTELLLTRGRLCTSVHVYWSKAAKSLERESCLHRCLDQAQHNKALILPDLGEPRAQTAPQCFYCVTESGFGLPPHLFWS